MYPTVSGSKTDYKAMGIKIGWGGIVTRMYNLINGITETIETDPRKPEL